MAWILWCIYMLFACAAVQGGRRNQKPRSSERSLFEYLMTSYDSGSRPVLNASDTVKVNFSISLNQIHDLAEKNQTLITHVWIHEEWIDERLRWDPSWFGGLDIAVLPSTRIWLPDIYIFNNADKGSDGFVASSDSKLQVRYDGAISWSIPLIIRTSCVVDIRYFPFDNQHCFVKFGSWIYEDSQLDLLLKDTEVDLSPPFSAHSELALRNATLSREVIQNDIIPGQYPQITMYIHIERKPVFYSYTVLAPTLVLCILSLFSFLLPCDNGDKVGIGLTVFLSLYVLQLGIAENIPESNSLPLIGLFLTLVMTLNAISLVFATLVINIKKKGDRFNCPRVPAFVLKICKIVFSKLTCTPFLNSYEFYGFCSAEFAAKANQAAAAANMQTDSYQQGFIEERTEHVNPVPYQSYVRCRNEVTSTGITALRPKPKQKHSKGSQNSNKIQIPYATRGRMPEEQLYINQAPYYNALQNPPRDGKYEWFFVAEVLDKSLFLLFLIGMILTIVVSLVIVPWLHKDD